MPSKARRTASRSRGWAISGLAATIVIAVPVWLLPAGRERPPVHFSEPNIEETAWPAPADRAQALRDSALRRARVWRPVDVAAADLSNNPPDPDGTLSEPLVRCQMVHREMGGTTPKFDCALPDGEVIRVKYGRTAEVPAEIATTRLLTALGFGADRVYRVSRLRCYGCPRVPYYSMRLFSFAHADAVLTSGAFAERYTDFEWVAVERKVGRSIEAGDIEGWAFYELDKAGTDGGASRAEIDALRLMAVFLSHWDNKAPNQRLACLSPVAAGAKGDRACPEPFAFIQDAGSTFGPKKVDLSRWRETAIWADRATCTVSMRDLPYQGATFPDVRISEGGRALLARQLEALTETQIRGLFTAARFEEAEGGGDVSGWVDAFRQKVRQVSDAKCG
jgi:hypothetical protein